MHGCQLFGQRILPNLLETVHGGIDPGRGAVSYPQLCIYCNADAQRFQMEIDPLGGEAVAKLLAAAYGAPREVYTRPANRTVADFMGLVNLIPGRVRRAGSSGAVRFGSRPMPTR